MKEELPPADYIEETASQSKTTVPNKTTTAPNSIFNHKSCQKRKPSSIVDQIIVANPSQDYLIK